MTKLSYVCVGISTGKKCIKYLWKALFSFFSSQTAQFKLNSSHKNGRIITGNFLLLLRAQTLFKCSLNRWKWLHIGNRFMCGKCSPAPTPKNQWVRGLAHKTQAHGKVLPWGTRPALYLGCYETCFCQNSPHPEFRQQMFTSIFNFLKSVLNLPSMECNQFNHFPPWAATSFSLK